MSEEKKNIGCLWSKVSAKGTKFLSGNVEINGVKHNIVVFTNKHKTNPNAPDYTIMPSDEYKKTEASNTQFIHPSRGRQ